VRNLALAGVAAVEPLPKSLFGVNLTPGRKLNLEIAL
jgi:hypothetical protein